MRVFDSFNPCGDPCPVCGTKAAAPTVLVPFRTVPGENLMECKQVHKECFDLLRKMQDAPAGAEGGE